MKLSIRCRTMTKEHCLSGTYLVLENLVLDRQGEGVQMHEKQCTAVMKIEIDA